MSVLDDILRDKVTEVTQRQKATTLAEHKETLASRTEDSSFLPRGFAAALRTRQQHANSAVIAEVKKASPSKGLIRADFNPAAIATSYEEGGAACLSVLTDTKYFQGADDYLLAARAASTLPVLRKDFIVNEYQIWETRALGADCLLLIAAALSEAQLADYYGVAREIGLDVLVEVHDAEELARAARLNVELLGVNNRNLKTFETTLDTTKELVGLAPQNALVISESGIHTKADIEFLRALNVHCYLIGEAFMREDNPGNALQALTR